MSQTPEIEVIDLSTLYGAGNIQHGALDIARLLTYMYGVGRVVLAWSPDVGVYHSVPEIEKYMDSEDPIEEYVRETGHRVVAVYDGYEWAWIDLDLEPDLDIDVVKTFRSGNSVVVAVRLQPDQHVKRVRISRDLILIDLL